MSDRFGTISIAPEKSSEQTAPQTKRQPQKRRPVKKQRTSSPKWPKTLITMTLIIVVFVAGYTAAGFLGVPWWLETQLPLKVKKHTGFILQFDNIQFNPFTFILKIKSTVLQSSEKAATPVLSVNTLHSNIALFPLLRGELVTKQLDLTDLRIHAVRNKDNHYNFDALIKGLDQSQPAEILNFSKLPFLFSLNNISISNSTITFLDIPKNTEHTVENIELRLPNLSNFSYKTDHYISPKLSATVNGSPIELTSQTVFPENSSTPQPEKTELSWKVNDLDLSHYFDYLATPFPVTVEQGKAKGVVKLSFALGEEEKIRAEFSLETKGLTLNDKQKDIILQVPTAKFEGTIHPVTGNTHFRHILFQDPTITTQSGRIEEIIRLCTIKKSDQTAKKGNKPPKLIIDLLVATDGIFQARNIKQTESPSWEALQCNVKNYRSHPDRSKEPPSTFRLSGTQHNGHGTLRWQGELTPANTLTGPLRIDDVATKDLFTWIQIDELDDASGTADLECVLTLDLTETVTKRLPVTISQGNLNLHDLALQNGTTTWYTAPLTRCNNVSINEKDVNFGKIRLKNAMLRLNSTQLPTLFHSIVKEKNAIRFTSLDFTGNIALSQNKSKKPHLNFDQVALHLSHPDLKKDTPSENLKVKAQLNNTGKIEATGEIGFFPVNGQLKTKFSDLDATKILPWLGSSEIFSKTTGKLYGQGNYIFPKTSFNGQLTLIHGQFPTTKQHPLRWGKLSLQNLRYQQHPFYLGSTTVSVEKPEVSLQNNLESPHPVASIIKFTRSWLPKTKQKQRNIRISPIEIQKLNIKDGIIHVTDHRVTPPWKSEINYFRGTIHNLTANQSIDNASTFSFSGHLDTLPFTLEGDIHLFAPNGRGNSLFNLTGYPFSSFHTQLGEQLDLNTSTGRCSLTTRSDWNSGQVNEQNQIIFENILPVSKDAASALPLALITDTNGKFEISINQKYPLNTPPEPLFNEVVTALKKLEIKASLSPYLVATGDYNDIVNNEYAEFLPGSIALSGAGREALTRFSSLLASHPYLGVIVTGAADKTVDAAALQDEQEQAEMERVAIENERLRATYEQKRKAHWEKIKKAIAQDPGQREILNKNQDFEDLEPFIPLEPEPVIIDDEMLEELAQKRARVIIDFFTNRLALEPERIQIAKRTKVSDTIKNGGNKVLFSLQASFPEKR